MNRVVDAPQFCHGLSKFCRAVVNSKRLHDRGRLYHTESEGAGKPEHVIPVLLYELRVDPMAGNAIQRTVIGRRIDPPVARSADIGEAQTKAVAEQPKQPASR